MGQWTGPKGGSRLGLVQSSLISRPRSLAASEQPGSRRVCAGAARADCRGVAIRDDPGVRAHSRALPGVRVAYLW